MSKYTATVDLPHWPITLSLTATDDEQARNIALFIAVNAMLKNAVVLIEQEDE